MEKATRPVQLWQLRPCKQKDLWHMRKRRCDLAWLPELQRASDRSTSLIQVATTMDIIKPPYMEIIKPPHVEYFGRGNYLFCIVRTVRDGRLEYEETYRMNGEWITRHTHASKLQKRFMSTRTAEKFLKEKLQ
jgi:hypothetical protein